MRRRTLTLCVCVRQFACSSRFSLCLCRQARRTKMLMFRFIFFSSQQCLAMTGQTIRVHTILRFVFVAFLSISLFIYFAVVSHRSHTLDVSCILSILFLRFCPVSIYLLLFCLCGNERSIVRVFSNVIELSRRAEQRRYGNNIHTKANSIHVQPRMVGVRWVDAQSVGCCCRRRYRWCIHAHTQSTHTGTGTVYLHSLLDKNRKESNGKWCLSNWLGSLASRVLLVFLFRISVCWFVCVWLCSPCSECLELELQLRMGDTNRINYRLNLLVITIIVGTHTHTQSGRQRWRASVWHRRSRCVCSDGLSLYSLSSSSLRVWHLLIHQNAFENAADRFRWPFRAQDAKWERRELVYMRVAY